MTSLRKSDAQLDAEASQPLEERDLDVAIELHRALYHGDLDWMMKLHVRDGESGIGVPFSPVFEAYLEGRFGQHPWMSARASLRQMCRTFHRPKHLDREEWRGSLCDALLVTVIRQEHPVAEAQRQLGLPNEGKTRRTLDNALLFLERKLEDGYWREQQQKPLERPPSEWMADVHVHVGLDGLHAVDCAQCIKRRAAA